MKIPYWILAIITVVIIILLMETCEDNRPVVYKTVKVDSIIKKTDTLKVEVVKWKEAKSRIVYRTKFDTLATINTVLIELAKCDTIVRIDSVIIAKQDTIIKGQEDVISELDLINQHQEKENKKLKRKLIFTKILAGAIVVLTIIASMK